MGRKFDYIDGIIYSTDNEIEYNLDSDEDCKKLMEYLNKMEYIYNEEKTEVARLCEVMTNCHEEIRVLSKNLDKEKRLKTTYRELSDYLFEAIRELDK